MSTYREYQKDLDSIAAWLASTSKKCGYLLQSVKPKSAARRPTKGKKKGKSKPRVAVETTRHIIRIEDLVPLAEFIATCDEKKPAPKAFFSTLNRVITARSSFGAELRSDDTNFMGILEKVRDLLKPLVGSDVSAN